MAFALTFDDGPGPSTLELVDLLGAHGCKATFFVIGENVTDDSKSIAVQVLQSGHLLGNHTVTHNGRLALRDLRREIDECDQILAQLYESAAVPCPRPIPFRLPYGIRTFLAERLENGVRRPAAALDNRLQVLASMGRTHVHWTAVLPDWEATSTADAKRLADQAFAHITAMEAEGLDAVLTMHDGSERDANGQIASREFTLQAVEQILTRAKEKNWGTFQVPVTNMG